MADPRYSAPMLATLVEEVPTGEEWIFEHKLDGVRIVAVRDGADVRLWSRNHKDRTGHYPEVADALRSVSPTRFVADGEVVAGDGRLSSFERLQQRRAGPGVGGDPRSEVHLYLFDLVHLHGEDLEDLPLRRRKEMLRTAIDFDDPLRFCTHRNGNGTGTGTALLAQACEQGFEGLIAKRAEGPYVHGRSRDWRKLKCVMGQEFVIGGFSEPSGARTALGALLVGYHDDDGVLRFAGRVGTGFDARELESLRGLLEPLAIGDAPFGNPPSGASAVGVHWVSPELVCEVGFTEWTGAGRLRHPRYLGLRDDKDPTEVVRERPGPRR